MDILKISKRADVVLGCVFLALAGYSVYQVDYLMAGVWIVSAAASFASAKFVPARWVLKKVMLARK
jgi:hypothetical protein